MIGILLGAYHGIPFRPCQCFCDDYVSGSQTIGCKRGYKAAPLADGGEETSLEVGRCRLRLNRQIQSIFNTFFE